MALEFLILTNVRTDAVLKAKWGEFDLDKALWTVPLVNLKDREHRTEPFEVPLSRRALEILRQMEKGRVSAFVFPGQKSSKALSNMAFLTLLKRMGGTKKPTKCEPEPEAKWIDPASSRPITAHGFRATFRTWAEEVATSRPRRSSTQWAIRSEARSSAPTIARRFSTCAGSSWTPGRPTASRKRPRTS